MNFKINPIRNDQVEIQSYLNFKDYFDPIRKNPKMLLEGPKAINTCNHLNELYYKVKTKYRKSHLENARYASKQDAG